MSTGLQNSTRYWEAVCRSQLQSYFTVRGAEIYLVTPSDRLGGRTPLEMIRDGHVQQVLDALADQMGG